MDIYRGKESNINSGYPFFLCEITFKSFVEDGNYIVVENHVLSSIVFHGGISVITFVLVNCNNFQYTKKIKNK